MEESLKIARNRKAWMRQLCHWSGSCVCLVCVNKHINKLITTTIIINDYVIIIHSIDSSSICQWCLTWLQPQRAGRWSHHTDNCQASGTDQILWTWIKTASDYTWLPLHPFLFSMNGISHLFLQQVWTRRFSGALLLIECDYFHRIVPYEHNPPLRNAGGGCSLGEPGDDRLVLDDVLYRHGTPWRII